MRKKIISIIVTCLNEQDNILEMYERVKKVFAKLQNYSYELIYVDNDSTDDSITLYNQIAKHDKKVKVLLMSRNFGSPQPSFLAGLEYSKGDAAILLHGDIQDPPELIPRLIAKWREGFEVVYGIRKSRKGYGFIYNFLFKSFYYILRKLSYINIPLNAGDFSLLDRQVINEVTKIDEYDYYLRGLRAYVGFRQTGIEYVRDARLKGSAGDSIWTYLYWAKIIIVNFSFRPLEYISYFAFIVMIISFLFIIFDIISILLFGVNSAKGIPTVVILILFMGGIQLLCLSIIAEYLSRIFLEVKKRPRYIIRKILNK